MRLTRVERLAVLVHRATFLRQCIALNKDSLSSELWQNHPNKHKKFYEEYEPRIKEYAYELAEVEAKINKLNPTQSDNSKENKKED